MKYEKTIWDLYTELFNDPSTWKYYSDFSVGKYNLENIMNNGDEAICFIKEYFQLGGKYEIVHDISCYCTPERARHSISTFFLGILLMPLFTKQYRNKQMPFDNFFLWLWFLTCLYHDMAYKIEEDKTNLLSLDKFMSRRKMKYKIIGDSKIKLKGANKKTVQAYYQYRIKECNCVDHGITGGLLLYDSLRKNYEKVYNEYAPNINGGHDDFTWNNLHFSVSHFREYEKCANAIIQHNLWFMAKENDGYMKYKKYHLEDLTYMPDSKPYYQDWLTALLVFCDTIEPIKRFNSCLPSSILKKIKLQFDDNEEYLKIFFTDTCMDTMPYSRSILDMKEWTNLLIKREGDTISILNINKMYK